MDSYSCKANSFCGDHSPTRVVTLPPPNPHDWDAQALEAVSSQCFLPDFDFVVSEREQLPASFQSKAPSVCQRTTPTRTPNGVFHPFRPSSSFFRLSGVAHEINDFPLFGVHPRSGCHGRFRP